MGLIGLITYCGIEEEFEKTDQYTSDKEKFKDQFITFDVQLITCVICKKMEEEEG